MSFVLTKELAGMIEQSEINCLESRLTAIKEIASNPMGVEIRKFGNATAFTAKYIPGPSFNRVLGMSGEEVKYINPILSFYQERNIPARFEITPAYASSDLLKSLAEKEFFHCGFHNSLYGSLSNELVSVTESNTSISIREFEKDEFEIFAEIYTKGFGLPSFLKEHVARNNEVLYNNRNWIFYMALFNGEPAGIGVLYESDGIGTLAASTTIPKFRNKGVHSALVLKRLERAKQLKCDLIVGQAGYGSVSQKNMERAGMKIAYTKGVWLST